MEIYICFIKGNNLVLISILYDNGLQSLLPSAFSGFQKKVTSGKDLYNLYIRGSNEAFWASSLIRKLCFSCGDSHISLHPSVCLILSRTQGCSKTNKGMRKCFLSSNAAPLTGEISSFCLKRSTLTHHLPTCRGSTASRCSLSAVHTMYVVFTVMSVAMHGVKIIGDWQLLQLLCKMSQQNQYSSLSGTLSMLVIKGSDKRFCIALQDLNCSFKDCYIPIFHV